MFCALTFVIVTTGFLLVEAVDTSGPAEFFADSSQLPLILAVYAACAVPHAIEFFRDVVRHVNYQYITDKFNKG